MRTVTPTDASYRVVIKKRVEEPTDEQLQDPEFDGFTYSYSRTYSRLASAKGMCTSEKRNSYHWRRYDLNTHTSYDLPKDAVDIYVEVAENRWVRYE